MKKSNFKTLCIYILVSIIITLLISNIIMLYDEGNLEYISKNYLKYKNNTSEILDEYYKNLEETTKSDANEIDNLNLQKRYEEEREKLATKYGITDNKDGFYMNVSLNYINRLNVMNTIKHINYDLLAILAGIILGILVYLIFNLRIKYNYLKIIIGYIITFAVTYLTASIIMASIYSETVGDVIKELYEFHIASYIIYITLGYISIVMINVLTQKIKANKLNKELKNSQDIK